MIEEIVHFLLFICGLIYPCNVSEQTTADSSPTDLNSMKCCFDVNFSYSFRHKHHLKRHLENVHSMTFMRPDRGAVTTIEQIEAFEIPTSHSSADIGKSALSNRYFTQICQLFFWKLVKWNKSHVYNHICWYSNLIGVCFNWQPCLLGFILSRNLIKCYVW